jgi:hypothetical protein
MTMGKIISALALAWLLPSSALGAEAGTALKPAEIKLAPYHDAKPAGSLAKGDKVEILKRQGGWYQIKSAKSSGWVRMLAIRRGEARKRSIDTDRIVGLASGRAGTGKVVATTGIRGLTEEELKQAKYNEAELKKVESFTTTEDALGKFTAEGRLVARKVDYLPIPN